MTAMVSKPDVDEGGAGQGATHASVSMRGPAITTPERPAAAAVTRATLTLSLAFIVVLLLTNPFGNFPLNDDWSYGQAVQSLGVCRRTP